MGQARKNAARSKDVICPKCRLAVLYRVSRKGFLEERLFSLLGFYPWECPGCRRRVRIKVRGVRKRRSSSSDTSITHSPHKAA